ncbi:MAG: hypothetical protein HZY73_11230 [Micropruina sp.]|nr:MAG: hypothetical protein HZY73_11230 [Micropruina sp.]
MTDTLDRTPPHDADAEQATLGSVMMSPSLLPDLRAVLDPADFYRPAHEQIWAAILALADRGHPFDMIAVGNELRIRGRSTRWAGRCTCTTWSPAWRWYPMPRTTRPLSASTPSAAG